MKCSCGCGAEGPKPKPLKAMAVELEQSTRHLRRYVKAGCPHHKKPGRTGALTFDRDEVLTWMRGLAPVGRPPAGLEKTDSLTGTSSPTTSTSTPGPLQELRTLTAKASLRIKQADAEKKERDNAVAAGSLAPIEDLRRFFLSQVTMIQTAFRALPGRLAPLLQDQDYDTIHGTLERELDTLLRQFSTEVPTW